MGESARSVSSAYFTAFSFASQKAGVGPRVSFQDKQMTVLFGDRPGPSPSHRVHHGYGLAELAVTSKGPVLFEGRLPPSATTASPGLRPREAPGVPDRLARTLPSQSAPGGPPVAVAPAHPRGTRAVSTPGFKRRFLPRSRMGSRSLLSIHEGRQNAPNAGQFV